MTIELYLNGAAVDLPTKQDLTLELKSNFLGDITKLQGSYSYSLTLPRTARNSRVLDAPEVLAHESTAARRYMDALLLVDGVNIFGGSGAAVLLGTSADGYSITLQWNGMRKYSSWLNDDPSIKDIPRKSIKWSRTPTAYTTGSVNPVNATYDPGVSLNIFTDIACHPAMSMSAILAQIINGMAEDPVPFGIPTDVDEELEKLMVVLTTRNSVKDSTALGFTAPRIYLPAGVYGNNAMKLYYTDGYYTDGNANYDTTSRNFEMKSGASEVRVRLKWSGYGRSEARQSFFQVIGVTADGKTETAYSYAINKSTSSYYIIDLDTTVDLDGYTSYYLQFDTNFLYSANDTRREYLTPVEFFVTPQFDTVYLGDDFATDNLPDIKQSDFIKAVCAIFNLAVVPDKYFSLGFNFVSRESLYDNESKALDWSSKLVGSGDPDEVDYSLDGYAIKTWYRYKETKNDEGVDADGCIEVDDETLEAETNFYTSPFAASNINTVPLYAAEYKDDEWQAKLQKIEPRVLELQNANGYCALRFTNRLDWQNILDGPRYTHTAAMLYKPVKVKCTMRLTAADIAAIDYSVPVYISQWGLYFAIDTIRFSTKGLSTVTLIKL